MTQHEAVGGGAWALGACLPAVQQRLFRRGFATLCWGRFVHVLGAIGITVIALMPLCAVWQSGEALVKLEFRIVQLETGWRNLVASYVRPGS